MTEDMTRELIELQHSIIVKMEEGFQEVARRYLALATDKDERTMVMQLVIAFKRMRDDVESVREDMRP